MSTILVPVDFSDVSENALDYAMAFASGIGSRIILLHAYHVFPTDQAIPKDKYDAELEDTRKYAQKKLEELKAKVERSSSCRCEYMNVVGMPEEEIVKHANLLNPDLLVMGTENLSPLDKELFGTITGRVIKEVHCSTLVVPENIPFRSPNKIAFAMDYHDSDKSEIIHVQEIADKFLSELHVVHVIPEDMNEEPEETFFEDFKREIKPSLDDHKLFFDLIKGNDAVDELLDYIKRQDIDLIAVAKTRKSLFERLVMGSVSQKLYYRSNIPLWVFRANG